MTCSACKIFFEYLKFYIWQGLGWNYFFGHTQCSQVFYFKSKQSLSGLVGPSENIDLRQAPNPKLCPCFLLNLFFFSQLFQLLCVTKERKCLFLCHLFLLVVKIHFKEQEYLLVCEGSRDKKRLKQYQGAKPQDGL